MKGKIIQNLLCIIIPLTGIYVAVGTVLIGNICNDHHELSDIYLNDSYILSVKAKPGYTEANGYQDDNGIGIPLTVAFPIITTVSIVIITTLSCVITGDYLEMRDMIREPIDGSKLIKPKIMSSWWIYYSKRFFLSIVPSCLVLMVAFLILYKVNFAKLDYLKAQGNGWSYDNINDFGFRQRVSTYKGSTVILVNAITVNCPIDQLPLARMLPSNQIISNSVCRYTSYEGMTIEVCCGQQIITQRYDKDEFYNDICDVLYGYVAFTLYWVLLTLTNFTLYFDLHKDFDKFYGDNPEFASKCMNTR